MSGVQRLFVALELPARESEALAAWGRSAARADPALRALAAGSLHLTLHFLGERPAAETGAVRSALAGTMRPAPLELHGTGALWLAPRRPQVLACGLREDSGALTDLHARLGAVLAHACDGWSPDRRRLHPHVTVARVRRGSRPATATVPPAPGLRFSPPALALLRSHLGRDGARYETLERVSLLTAS